jgi:uncharacterized protein YlxW (UPF0749 family)
MTRNGDSDTGRDAEPRGGVLSTSLLVDVTTISVDPAYVEAAARRASAGEEPGRSSRGGALFVAVVVLLGLLVGAAARQTRLRAPELARTRALLVERIEDLAEQTDDDGRRLDRLRRELASVRDQHLDATDTGRELSERLGRLEQEVGAVAVNGPGIVVRLSDAPVQEGRRRPEDAPRVQDRDVQDVVNALWAAGAEAVSVNGQRIGPLTAIRQAGDAILVDYRPVSSPYDVSAIGDANTIEPAFAGSAIAQVFRTPEMNWLGFSVRRAKRLELPAAGGSRVAIAQPSRQAPPAGSRSPTGTGSASPTESSR